VRPYSILAQAISLKKCERVGDRAVTEPSMWVTEPSKWQSGQPLRTWAERVSQPLVPETPNPGQASSSAANIERVSQPLVPETMDLQGDLGGFAAQHGLTILASGDAQMLIRPCVDCGLWTGRFCDFCYAAARLPNEEWADGQLTPLCSDCDNLRGGCHFCCGVKWCVPPPWGGQRSRQALARMSHQVASR
jgi:hypothetical protein